MGYLIYFLLILSMGYLIYYLSFIFIIYFFINLLIT
jgi:hypothetical protein